MIVSITSAATEALAEARNSPYAIIAILALTALVIQKEALSGADNPRLARWSRGLDVAIAPLVAVFVLAALLRLASVMG